MLLRQICPLMKATSYRETAPRILSRCCTCSSVPCLSDLVGSVQGQRTFSSAASSSLGGSGKGGKGVWDEKKFGKSIPSAADRHGNKSYSDAAITYHDADDVLPTGHTESGLNFPHPIWPANQLENVRIKHSPPVKFVDRLALFAVRVLRIGFDVTSGYAFGKLNEAKWIRRIVFLETVAGVPGMMGAMVRHLKSLRTMKRDHGWIHTLLEEAENERMHLMVALHLQQPGVVFRIGTLVTQGVFTNVFFLAYLCSSRFCHRFVGYLEEEAVKTYTKLIQDIDMGPMIAWKTDPAPEMAIRYWRMPPGSTKRDMILAIRADEAHHRLVNHALASIKPTERNPFAPKDEP